MVTRTALGNILGEATISTGNIPYEAMRTQGSSTESAARQKSGAVGDGRGRKSMKRKLQCFLRLTTLVREADAPESLAGYGIGRGGPR
jgi:hypothetical protein